jgi:hypothetical protein
MNFCFKQTKKDVDETAIYAGKKQRFSRKLTQQTNQCNAVKFFVIVGLTINENSDGGLQLEMKKLVNSRLSLKQGLHLLTRQNGYDT